MPLVELDDGTYYTTLRTDTFVDGDVNTSTNRITVTATPFNDADGPVQLTTTGVIPEGWQTNTDVFIKKIDANTIELYPSRNDARAGTNILNVTAAAGGGTHTITDGSLLKDFWDTFQNYDNITIVGKGPGCSEVYGRLDFTQDVGTPNNIDCRHFSHYPLATPESGYLMQLRNVNRIYFQDVWMHPAVSTHALLISVTDSGDKGSDPGWPARNAPVAAARISRSQFYGLHIYGAGGGIQIQNALTVKTVKNETINHIAFIGGHIAVDERPFRLLGGTPDPANGYYGATHITFTDFSVTVMDTTPSNQNYLWLSDAGAYLQWKGGGIEADNPARDDVTYLISGTSQDNRINWIGFDKDPDRHFTIIPP